jgi:hypothetical protein
MRATASISILNDLLVPEEVTGLDSRPPCPAPKLLAALCAGGVDDDTRQSLMRHAAQCAVCADLLGRLRAFSNEECEGDVGCDAERAWRSAKPRIERAVIRSMAPKREQKVHFLSFLTLLPAPSKWVLSGCAAVLLLGFSLILLRPSGWTAAWLAASGSSAPDQPRKGEDDSGKTGPTIPRSWDNDSGSNASSWLLPGTGGQQGVETTSNASQQAALDSVRPQTRGPHGLPSVPGSAGAVARLWLISVSQRGGSGFSISGKLVFADSTEALVYATLEPGAASTVLKMTRFSSKGQDFVYAPPHPLRAAVIWPTDNVLIRPQASLEIHVLGQAGL